MNKGAESVWVKTDLFAFHNGISLFYIKISRHTSSCQRVLYQSGLMKWNKLCTKWLWICNTMFVWLQQCLVCERREIFRIFTKRMSVVFFKHVTWMVVVVAYRLRLLTCSIVYQRHPLDGPVTPTCTALYSSNIIIFSLRYVRD